jgi:hypothetical protein
MVTLDRLSTEEKEAAIEAGTTAATADMVGAAADTVAGGMAGSGRLLSS